MPLSNDSSIALAVVGSGGAGSITAGEMLVGTAGKHGLYATINRSVGPAIRGGEALAMVRISTQPIISPPDRYDFMLAFDWANVERFEAEIPLHDGSLILWDPDPGPMPESMSGKGQQYEVPLTDMAKEIPGDARVNMIALGLICTLIGLSTEKLVEVVDGRFGRKSKEIVEVSKKAIEAGAAKAASINRGQLKPLVLPSAEEQAANAKQRWVLTGNEATAVGILRGGVKFVAAYPITPATDMLEWMAPRMPPLGGRLVQLEDELAAMNAIVGASYAGVPSMTATSGPGLALMSESIGLSIASETPVVVVNVQRGGPSTGIPTKSEQTDLNIALNGMHGDAPHIVVAPRSMYDCVGVAQRSVHLAETLQAPVIMMTDQFTAHQRAVIDVPPTLTFTDGGRLYVDLPTENYERYAITDDGVSPMAHPGDKNCAYTADGLEHTPTGTPSSAAQHHAEQLDKRRDKLEQYDFGDMWVDTEDLGPADAPVTLGVITWGSSAGPVQEAADRLAASGTRLRIIVPRLLMPVQTDKMNKLLEDLDRLLVVELSHSKQFLSYLRANFTLPGIVSCLNRAGPLPFRPFEVVDAWQAMVDERTA